MEDKQVINIQRIRLLRDKKGLKQSDIARILGYKADTYLKIETGRRGISIKKLIVLAKFYNVSVDELLIK